MTNTNWDKNTTVDALRRGTRFIPNGFIKFDPKYIIGAYSENLFECYVDKEKPAAIFYTGKQSKHTWYNSFRDNESMKKKIIDTILRLMSWEDMKAERKDERKGKNANLDVSLVKIGDIYHWSGGYNCTRNSYIKVISIKGKKCEVAELPKYQVDGDWMNGNVAPVIDGAVGRTITMVMRPSYFGEGVMLRDTKTGHKDNYTKWDGKPNWENCD